MTSVDASSAKIDSKGRILLPPALRSELDLEPGDCFAQEDEGGSDRHSRWRNGLHFQAQTDAGDITVKAWKTFGPYSFKAETDLEDSLVLGQRAGHQHPLLCARSCLPGKPEV